MRQHAFFLHFFRNTAQNETFDAEINDSELLCRREQDRSPGKSSITVTTSLIKPDHFQGRYH